MNSVYDPRMDRYAKDEGFIGVKQILEKKSGAWNVEFVICVMSLFHTVVLYNFLMLVVSFFLIMIKSIQNNSGLKKKLEIFFLLRNSIKTHVFLKAYMIM